MNSTIPELQIIDGWISGDVRPGRKEEKWLNPIIRKSIIRFVWNNTPIVHIPVCM